MLDDILECESERIKEKLSNYANRDSPLQMKIKVNGK